MDFPEDNKIDFRGYAVFNEIIMQVARHRH